MLRPGITAVVAAHPIRLKNGLLTRAVNSIFTQSLQPEAIIIVNDKEKKGAGWTRRTILDRVDTQWMAWLDSDDWWYQNHLQVLWDAAQADPNIKYTFSYFDGRFDPLGHFGKTYDVHNPHHTTITALVDTELAKEVGYTDTAMDWPVSNEDLVFIFAFAELCAKRGYQMVHVPQRTWYYEQAGQNTSGKPNQGDAA